jgi:type I restriction enzyme M protein
LFRTGARFPVPVHRHRDLLHQRPRSRTNPDGRFRAYDDSELTARDKCSLDVFWLKDESLEASQNLPPPGEIAREIVEDLRVALEQFESVASDLGAA